MTPTPVKRYSVGFLMNQEPATGLALVRLPGYAFLNGISGLVEHGETPEQRIIRATATLELRILGPPPTVASDPWDLTVTVGSPKLSEDGAVLFLRWAIDTKDSLPARSLVHGKGGLEVSLEDPSLLISNGRSVTISRGPFRCVLTDLRASVI